MPVTPGICADCGGGEVTVLGSVEISNDVGNPVPVSGTVAVTQSTSPWVVSGTVTTDTELPAASALADADPNPTTSRIGANSLVFNGTTWDRVRSGTALGSVLVNNPTAANLNATVGNAAGASAVNIQDGGNSITVDGTVAVSGTVTTGAGKAEDSGHTSGDTGDFVLAVRNDTAGTLVDANLDYAPLQVNSTGELRTAVTNPATGATTSVASSASAVTVLASNSARRGATVWNDSTQVLYLLLGAGTVSTTVYSVQLAAGAYYEVPFGFTGALTGLWASANGNARVTEITA